LLPEVKQFSPMRNTPVAICFVVPHGKDQLEGPQNKYAGSADGRRTTIADECNPSKTKELDRSYTPRKLTIENSSRREDGRKKNKREAKDQDA